MPDDPHATPGRIVVAGASGLIGEALVASLRADGVAVTRLVRRPAETLDEVEWDPMRRRLDPAVLAGAKAVVGLNGASIGRFPWSRSYKHTLVWSRLAPTQALASAIRSLGDDAPAFVSASAVGYYPTQPDGPLTERSEAGRGFLSELTVEWERAARTAGDDVALLRTAPIVHPEGVLAPLMLLTKAGLSGPIGRGAQAWPWISLPDEVAAIRHVIDAGITGPVNLSGPTRATANDLGFALAMRMNRPYLLRAPVWGMKLALGSEPVEALLTCDMHVIPEVLTASGFVFAQPTVKDAVRQAVPEG